MTADLRAQFLRSQGLLVIKCDNRGSDRRGLPFEASIQGKLGQLEVDDQVLYTYHGYTYCGCTYCGCTYCGKPGQLEVGRQLISSQ